MYKTYKKSGSFTDCVVDLKLAGRGDDVEQLREQYKGALAGTTIAGTTISVQKTGKSASFRVQVPRIVPPQFDEEKVREALGAASKLKAWWEAIGAAR